MGLADFRSRSTALTTYSSITYISPRSPYLKLSPKCAADLGAQSPADRKAIQYVLRRFFKRSRDGYTQKRFEEELTFVNSRRYASRENGKKGGRPKKTPETQQVNNGKPTETQQVFLGSYARENLEKPDYSDSKDSKDRVAQPEIMQVLGISLSLFTDYRKVRESTHHPIVPGAEDLIFAELLEFQTRRESG